MNWFMSRTGLVIERNVPIGGKLLGYCANNSLGNLKQNFPFLPEEILRSSFPQLVEFNFQMKITDT